MEVQSIYANLKSFWEVKIKNKNKMNWNTYLLVIINGYLYKNNS